MSHTKLSVRGLVVSIAIVFVSTIALADTVFDYGIASRGPVEMSGNSSVCGDLGNVLAASYGEDYALEATGVSKIDGSVFLPNSDASVYLYGSIGVGGRLYSGQRTITQETVNGQPDAYKPFCFGVGPEFPDIDTSVFRPFATNAISRSTNTTGAAFTNIRVPANTNPTFTSCTFNGVIFIEQPNVVIFTGNTTITGVVATSPLLPGWHSDIEFTGNTVAHSVTDLPDDPQFAGLRDLPGTFLLAPGFDVRLDDVTISSAGCMAADSFAIGPIASVAGGPIISYGQGGVQMLGNAMFTRGSDSYTSLPPGFTPEPAAMTLLAGAAWPLLRHRRRA